MDPKFNEECVDRFIAEQAKLKPKPVMIGSKWLDKGGRVWEVMDIERRPFGHVSLLHRTKERCLLADVYHRQLRANYSETK